MRIQESEKLIKNEKHVWSIFPTILLPIELVKVEFRPCRRPCLAYFGCPQFLRTMRVNMFSRPVIFWPLVLDILLKSPSFSDCGANFCATCFPTWRQNQVKIVQVQHSLRLSFNAILDRSFIDVGCSLNDFLARKFDRKNQYKNEANKTSRQNGRNSKNLKNKLRLFQCFCVSPGVNE